MYKKIKKMMLLSSIVGLFIICFIIIFQNIISWQEFSRDYRTEQEEKVKYFFDEQEEDLESILNSHAVWTDALDNLKAKNSNWLYENATGYMVGHSSYNIDFIYISNEAEDYTEFYSETNDTYDLTTLMIYKEVLRNDIPQEKLLWLDEKLVLISASPFFENNQENPSGVYLIGKIIDENETDDLSILLSKNEVTGIDFSSKRSKEADGFQRLGNFRIDVPLNESKTIFANIVFDLNYLSYLFYFQPFIIVFLIALIMGVLLHYINKNIEYMTMKLEEVIHFIERISDGEYHLEIERKKGSLIPELESLVTSTNRMAEDIRYNMDSIEERNMQLDEKYNEVINLLNNVVEMNDQYTYHHSSQVEKYAFLLGEAIDFEDLENLSLAAKLHDIGKVAIPTEILNKPSRLTEEEFDIIKTHSKKGYDLLSRSKIFHEARMGVLYHHERYDGFGYPMGLTGEDIPMMAQIITVADAYEAMTSDRSYRKAMSEEKALDILVKEKGKMFNPYLVDTFIKIIREEHLNE